MIRPVIHVTGQSVGRVLSAAQKAEKATISDAKSRIPAIIRKAVRARYRGLAASDPGLKPKVRTGRGAGSLLSIGERLSALRFEYRGARHHVTALGLGADFTGRRRDPATGALTAYGRQWANAARPYQVRTPLHRRETFGADKRGLFVVRSGKQGLPLLFQRAEGSRSIAPVVSIATPQAVRQRETEAVWRPRMNALLADRLRHHMQRFGI